MTLRAPQRPDLSCSVTVDYGANLMSLHADNARSFVLLGRRQQSRAAPCGVAVFAFEPDVYRVLVAIDGITYSSEPFYAGPPGPGSSGVVYLPGVLHG